tara:strand:- start:1458 stop:2393 length:936 start_codon:yes stop_codon:yes gene_type:complete
MSTLATNKLGTLAGTADMSLPKTRPSATETGSLDQNGNLTFGSSEVENVPTFVTDDNGLVCKVLVDQVCSGSNSNAAQSTTVSSSNNGYYGYSVGVHNAPDDLKTNYLFAGNIRTMEIDYSFYVNSSTYGGIEGAMYYVPLNLSGSRLWQFEQQRMVWSYATENPDSSGSPSGSGNTSAAEGSNDSGAEYNYSLDGIYSGGIKAGKIYWNCAVNSWYMPWSNQFNLRYRRTNGVNDSWPTRDFTSLMYNAEGYENTSRAQNAGSSSKGYGSPWDTQGGCLFTGGSTSTAPAMNYFTATCYAVIKPTALVAT